MAQTDNSHLADKVALRLGHMPDCDPVRVLDCYAGYGRIWRAVRKLSDRDIRVLPIDKRGWGFCLPGDNRAYLGSLDLERFDIIDLDAYGSPFEQLKTVLDRGYNGTIFVTFIQSVMGQINHDLLRDVGFTVDMIGKSPVLLCKRGWQYFCEWLAAQGVATIWHRQHDRKHYLGFRR